MAHSTAERNDAVDIDLGLELYERMALIRRFEDSSVAVSEG
jgi:TPP-dependent pyruvate/acetoin dehydrogenase alpha subunit